MISLDVEEMKLLVGKSPGGVCFVPGIGSTLKEGVFVWKEGIGNKSFEFCA